jgi:hypothetical protein
LELYLERQPEERPVERVRDLLGSLRVVGRIWASAIAIT